MQADIATYAAVLAVINYPVVIGIERLVERQSDRTVYDVPAPLDQRAREIRNSFMTAPIHALLFFLFIGFGWMRTGPESVVLVIATFVLTFAWTEIWHYASHVAMHHRWLHFIHREHHRSRITTPWTSMSFALGEKLIFSIGILGVLALLSRLHALSALGVFLYYLVYFVTNTIGHANFEFRAPEYRKTWMGKLFNSPSYHAMHHARYVRNYGLLTPWPDALFGTRWEDESDVQTRAANGQALKRLGERVGNAVSIDPAGKA